MLQQIRMFKAQTCDDDESLIDILSKVWKIVFLQMCTSIYTMIHSEMWRSCNKILDRGPLNKKLN